VQDDEAARGASAGVCVVKGFRDRRKSWDAGEVPGLVDAESFGPRRTMVLLVKQVHLQNEGGAGGVSQVEAFEVLKGELTSS
jgi:hypothetical protein